MPYDWLVLDPWNMSFTFIPMYHVGSKLECFFPLQSCCEQLPHLEAFVSTKLQYLPPTGNRRGCSTQKVLGVNRQHVWMSGSAPLSLIQVRPTSIVSRKSKNTALHFDFDHFSTFLNTHGGNHRWLDFRVKFSSLPIKNECGNSIVGYVETGFNRDVPLY